MRKKIEYLPKLLEYIALVNKIPNDFAFPSFAGIYQLTQERVIKQEDGCSFDDLIETYQEISKVFPNELYKYVFSESGLEDSDEVLKSIRRKFDLLSSLSHGLETLAYAVTEERISNEPLMETIQAVEEFTPEYSSIATASLSVSKEGFLELKTTEFFDFITTYKIEARRIRFCLMCHKIFWASRIDNWTCSKGCGNKMRQKSWRNENKDEYNEKRRQNYAYKKSMKQIKEKKNNGNLQKR